MKISVDDLRAAGVSDKQILDALAIADARRDVKERGQSKVRSRNYRERQANVTGITRDERDLRDERDAQVSKLTATSNSHIKKKKKDKHLLSENWQLAEADRVYARTKGWPDSRIETEGERFRLYYLTKQTEITNEHLTWCKWVMSPIQNSNGGHGNGNGQGRPAPKDDPKSIRGAFDRLFERLNRSDEDGELPCETNFRVISGGSGE